MLSYFESFPGFSLPVSLLTDAIMSLLDHKNQDAISKFNQWVLITPKVKSLQTLDLEVVGQISFILQTASRSRLKEILADAKKVIR